MRPVLIVGAAGTLGSAFARICELRGLVHVAAPRAALDVSDPAAIDAALEHHRPWLVVNAAGYVRVDDAEAEPERCRRDNTLAAAALASACARRAVPLITFSTDLVFDGAKHAPYDEDDRRAPLGVYGRTKAEAEDYVLDAHPGALVVRTSAFFGPWDDHNFVTRALRDHAAGRPVRAGASIVSPTYVPDLVGACLDLAIDGACGVWHVANQGALRWSELAALALRLAGTPGAVIETSDAELGLRAPRPRFSALTSARASVMPPLADALARYLVEAPWRNARS